MGKLRSAPLFCVTAERTPTIIYVTILTYGISSDAESWAQFGEE